MSNKCNKFNWKRKLFIKFLSPFAPQFLSYDIRRSLRFNGSDELFVLFECIFIFCEAKHSHFDQSPERSSIWNTDAHNSPSFGRCYLPIEFPWKLFNLDLLWNIRNWNWRLLLLQSDRSSWSKENFTSLNNGASLHRDHLISLLWYNFVVRTMDGNPHNRFWYLYRGQRENTSHRGDTKPQFSKHQHWDWTSSDQYTFDYLKTEAHWKSPNLAICPSEDHLKIAKRMRKWFRWNPQWLSFYILLSVRDCAIPSGIEIRTFFSSLECDC